MPETKNLAYEWDVERPIFEDGEEVDIEHDHFETYAEAVAFAKQTEAPTRIVLVRDDFRFVYDRCWAYVKTTPEGDVYLPPFFAEPNAAGEYRSNGVKVPQRFLREVLALHRSPAVAR